MATVRKTLKGIEFHERLLHSITFANMRSCKYYKFAKSNVRPRIMRSSVTSMSDRVYIFDTTLRDGEQSPGCSMTVPEKLRMARKLVELGVDILEAGFPIASEGDFEAVDAVSREFPWAQVAALARCCTLDVERAAAVAGARQAAAHPHLHRHQRYPPEVQAEEDRSSRCWTKPWPRSNWRGSHVDDVEFSAEDGARTDPDFLEKISQGRGRRRRAHGQHSRHGGLLDAEGIRRADRPHREGAGRLRRSSACTATTIWDWRWRTRWPRSRPARGRSSAPSTASASAPATARSKRS